MRSFEKGKKWLWLSNISNIIRGLYTVFELPKSKKMSGNWFLLIHFIERSHWILYKSIKIRPRSRLLSALSCLIQISTALILQIMQMLSIFHPPTNRFPLTIHSIGSLAIVVVELTIRLSKISLLLFYFLVVSAADLQVCCY